MRELRIIVVFLCLASVVAAARAEVINVSVDGNPVQFQGVAAQAVNGRVLVPLRGVLERMGAFVGWDAANRTVIAQRGDRDVSLPIGSRTAKVNGRDVQLDVPAIVMSGTTMVPLRFVGEALGADVTWNAATRTVEIMSQGEAAVVQPPQAGPSIGSFTHDATDWLIAGDKLKVTLIGTAGGSANFEIPGVASATSMRETSPGKYEATWTVPPDAHSITGAGVIARLGVAGQSLLIQAGTLISVDVTPPDIQNLTPQTDSSVAQLKPGISATFADGSGSGIDQSSLKLVVDGVDVTTNSNVTETFVSYKPAASLQMGVRTVTLTVRDIARNTASTTWEFTIKEASQVIKSVTYTAPTDLAPGDVISVRVEGQAGGKASFWFASADGSKLRPQTMQESPAGVYQAEYTFRRDDNLKGCGIVGSLTTAAGETFTMTADGKLGGQAASLSAPRITAPANGSTVSSPVTITGKASAGAELRLVVTYASTIMGAISFTGAVDDQTVKADGQGVFQSKPVELGTLVGGKDTVYTLRAWIVNADGTQSETTVVKFKKK